MGPSLQITRKATCIISLTVGLRARHVGGSFFGTWSPGQKASETYHTTRHTSLFSSLSADFLVRVAFCVIVARAALTVNGLPIVQKHQHTIYTQSWSQVMADCMTCNSQQQWNATYTVQLLYLCFQITKVMHILQQQQAGQRDADMRQCFFDAFCFDRMLIENGLAANDCQPR